MSETHQEEQQQPNRRGMRCEIHGIYFNPDLTHGCVLCQREAVPAKKPRTLPLTAAVLASVLVALLATAQLRRSPAPSAEASTTASSKTAEPTVPGQLDPTPFRKEIEALERILYDPAPSGLVTADRVSSAARRLSARFRDEAHGLNSMRAMTRILSFAARTESEVDAGYATLDLPSTRQRWEELRGEIFQPADWFQHSTESLREAQTPKPPQVDRQLVSNLKKTARDLELLIVKGRPEAEAIGEPYVDAPERSAELKRLGQQWNRWARQWSRQLERAAGRFPSNPPLDGDSRLLTAYNHVGRAMQHLNAIPYGANDSGIPFRARRLSLFDQAQQAIDQAQEILDKI